MTVRRAFQVGGVAGLVEERRGPKGPHPNRVSEEVEEKILAYSLDFPTHGVSSAWPTNFGCRT